MGRAKLSLFLFILCAVKCLSMSYNELEDFAEHLKKTSQLSPVLKKGGDPDVDYDEDEIISDHAWEDSGKFEGDLILNERQRRLIVEDVAEGLSRNGLKDGTKRWPNNEVTYYIQVEHFNSDQVQAIESGIEDIARASCVKFRPYRKGDRDAVVIQGSRRGCFSQVGYQGGYQVLNLSGRHPVGRGCFRHGTVVHELLHTLGFYHMQSSPDRDDYVDIVWPNIVKRARHNFRKYNTFSVSDFGVGYDYDSVLHYSRRAFSSNGQDTIIPKEGGAQIGQRLGLSDKDTQKLNKMYCDADSDTVQADENTAKKTPRKKKNGKNKPFEGHGIGYHQGKTVAIKILPAPETYSLPDVPSFHVFDYFSKAPQILSTAQNEGFRIGKEIANSNSPPQPVVITKEITIPVDFNSKVEEFSDQNQSHKLINNKKEIKELSKPDEKQENDFKTTNNSAKHEESSSYDKTTDPETLDAFERLEKIIRSHVYPSHTPDLSIYKVHEPYVEAYNPPKIIEQNYKLVSPIASNEGRLDTKKTHAANKLKNNINDYSSEKPSSKETNDGYSDTFKNYQSNHEDESEVVPDNEHNPILPYEKSVFVGSHKSRKIIEQNYEEAPVANNDGKLEITKINTDDIFHHNNHDYSLEKPALKQTNEENNDTYKNYQSNIQGESEVDAPDNEYKYTFEPLSYDGIYDFPKIKELNYKFVYPIVKNKEGELERKKIHSDDSHNIYDDGLEKSSSKLTNDRNSVTYKNYKINNKKEMEKDQSDNHQKPISTTKPSFIESYNPPKVTINYYKLASPIESNESEFKTKKINSANRFNHNLYDHSSEKSLLKPTNNDESETNDNNQSNNEEESEVDVSDNEYKPISLYNPPSLKYYEDEYVSTLPKSYKDRYVGIYSSNKHSDENSKKNKSERNQKYVPYYPDHAYYKEYAKSALKEIPEYGDEINDENIYSSSIPTRNNDYSLYRFPAFINKNWYKTIDGNS